MTPPHATDTVHKIRILYERANETAVEWLQAIPSEKERIAAEKMLAAIGIVIHPTDADDAGELVDAPQE